MKFQLKLYDHTLLSFDYSENSERQENCKILNYDKLNTHLLPIGLDLTDEGLLTWLKQRVIPKNREFVETILSRMGLSRNNTMGIIQICKGLSLNDCYWIVEDGFEGKFSDFNLYENNFTRTLALIAYTGYGSITARVFTSSPEFTTNGMLKKCWRRINGEVYLYKGGTMGAANSGNEPYSEFYAAQIAEAMGINHVEYGLSKWKDTLSSTCKLFTDINTAYVPMYKIVGKKDTLSEIAEYLKTLGNDYYNQFVDMLVFDAVIFNTDRHLGNFGLLIDSKTNQPISFAPVFDNGLSLFNFAMEDDLNDLSKYAKTRTPSLATTHEYIVKTFMSDRQKAQLRKLLNFSFSKHSRYNLPSQRLSVIQKFIRLRAAELLEM